MSLESQWTKHDRALELVREFFPNTTDAEANEILFAANRGVAPERDGFDGTGRAYYRHWAKESIIRARLESTRALFMRTFRVGEA